jgi:hypothetical protein
MWTAITVIGFILLLGFAFIGLIFTARAWVFAARLASEEYKHKKLNQTDPEVKLKIILTDAEKQLLKESENGPKTKNK